MSNKKIKIEIKNADNLEFYIKEDAKSGDYFCINDLTNINLDEVKNFFSEYAEKQKENLIKKLRESEKHNWLNEFKNSSEYLSLKEENILLKNKIEQDIKNKELEIEKRYIDQINQLKTNIEKMKFEEQAVINKLTLQFNNDKNNLNIEHIKEINEYKDKINILERNKQQVTTKKLGENFEIDIFNLLSQHYSMRENIIYRKQTTNNEDTKADFVIELLDENKVIFDSITIEAKAIQSTNGTKKNSDFFNKLNKDSKNNNSSFAILVSELEPHLNFDIMKVREYENMFVVRWQYLITIIDLMIFIINKKNELNRIIKNQNINFKEKELILADFENFKSSILNNSLKNIEQNIEKIKVSAENISKQANNILDSIRVIVDSHINSIKNKIDGFNIQNKIIKKIDKLQEVEIIDEQNMIITKKIS